MTVVQSRPILRVKPAADAPNRPLLLTALIATGWVAAGGLVLACTLAVLAWFNADTGSFGGAVRVGAAGWLVAQGSGIEVGGVAVTAIPLGSCLLAGLLLYRAGRWAGATSWVPSVGVAAGGAAVMAAAYAGCGAVVWAASRGVAADIDPIRAAVALAAIAVVFGGLGIVRGADLSDELFELVPVDARSVLVGGVAGFFVMTGAAAVLFTASMVTHFGDAVTLAEGMHAGLVGGLVIALIGLAAVPNAVLCAGAFAVGPGFLLGTGTSVSPAAVDLGPLPAIPILAAVPRSGGAWWQEALVILPLLAGAVAGVVAVVRFPVDGWAAVALRGAAAGLFGGLAYGGAGWLATGAIGPGRMSEVGPDVLPVLLICLAAFSIGGCAAAAGRNLLLDGVPGWQRGGSATVDSD